MSEIPVQCFVPTSGMAYLVAGSNAGYVRWDDYAALKTRLQEVEAELLEARRVHREPPPLPDGGRWWHGHA